MRSTYVFVLLSAVFAAPAGATELQIVCPPLVRDGMTDLAAAYTRQTGVTVVVRSDVMGKIMGDVETGTPAPDVVLLPPDLMDALVKNNGVKPGTRVAVGRVEIALAVRPGAPHPDISTMEKLRAVLRGAKMLSYTQPGPPRNSMEAGIIGHMLHRPDFTGIHTMTVATGSGVSALAKGDSDLALQVIPEITAQPGLNWWVRCHRNWRRTLIPRSRYPLGQPTRRMLRPSSSTSPGPKQQRCGNNLDLIAGPEVLGPADIVGCFTTAALEKCPLAQSGHWAAISVWSHTSV